MIVRGSIDIGCDRCGETADLDREASTPLERVRAEAADYVAPSAARKAVAK